MYFHCYKDSFLFWDPKKEVSKVLNIFNKGMIPDLPQKVPLFNSPHSNQEKPAHPHTFSPAQIVVTKRREMLPCFVSIFQYQLLFSIFQLHLNSRGYWDCDLLIRHYFHFPPCSPQFSLFLSPNAQYLITPHTKNKKVAGNFFFIFYFLRKNPSK